MSSVLLDPDHLQIPTDLSEQIRLLLELMAAQSFDSALLVPQPGAEFDRSDPMAILASAEGSVAGLRQAIADMRAIHFEQFDDGDSYKTQVLKFAGRCEAVLADPLNVEAKIKLRLQRIARSKARRARRFAATVAANRDDYDRQASRVFLIVPMIGGAWLGLAALLYVERSSSLLARLELIDSPWSALGWAATGLLGLWVLSMVIWLIWAAVQDALTRVTSHDR